MKLDVNDPLWSTIYRNISRDINFMSGTTTGWDGSLAQYGVKVERAVDRRVTHVILPEGEELTLFLLKWARK